MVGAPHYRVWRLFHPEEDGLRVPRSFDHPNGSITIPVSYTHLTLPTKA